MRKYIIIFALLIFSLLIGAKEQNHKFEYNQIPEIKLKANVPVTDYQKSHRFWQFTRCYRTREYEEINNEPTKEWVKEDSWFLNVYFVKGISCIEPHDCLEQNVIIDIWFYDKDKRIKTCYQWIISDLNNDSKVDRGSFGILVEDEHNIVDMDKIRTTILSSSNDLAYLQKHFDNIIMLLKSRLTEQTV